MEAGSPVGGSRVHGGAAGTERSLTSDLFPFPNKFWFASESLGPYFCFLSLSI